MSDRQNVHVSVSDERSRRCPVTDTSWQSSARYGLCRQEVVQCLVHQHGDLEMNTLADWKPMWLLQDGRDMLSPSHVVVHQHGDLDTDIVLRQAMMRTLSTAKRLC